MKKQLEKLLLLACLTGALTSLPGQHDVLFIGNSFTRGDTPSVPEIFDALARAGGQEDPVSVMRAVDGKRFSWHAQDATTLDNINSREWDFVILQNYSTEPTHIGSVSNHLLYGGILYDQVMANHSATHVILYETWSRSAAHDLITNGTFSSTSAMQQELRSNYQLLADRLNTNHPENPPVVVAPCGTAWENSGALRDASDPGFIKLHGPDEYHGNDAGYYLNAAVFYAMIYGESPEGLHLTPTIQNLAGLNVSDADLASLEEIAWSTYQDAMGDLPRQFSPDKHTVSRDGMEITIGFNGQLAPGPATDPANYSVISEATHIPVVSATLSADGLTVTLVMGAPLFTDYQVEISTAVVDSAGNPVDGSTTLSGTLPSATSRTVLFDFGGASFTAVDGDGMHWNNSESIARTDSGILSNIVDSTGSATPYTVEMVRRFTGTNTNGTTSSALFPATATGDSNYGNTASWSGLSNMFPAFRITGLDSGSTYSLLFYASRMNVSDNRETKFTVTGETVTTATINPANNVDNHTKLTGLKPDASNTILIGIGPGPNNNNSYNFTHLGVLMLSMAAPATGPVQFDAVRVENGNLVLEWQGDASLDTARLRCALSNESNARVDHRHVRAWLIYSQMGCFHCTA